MKRKRLAATYLPAFLLPLILGCLASTAQAGDLFYSSTPGAPPSAARAIRICETIDSTAPEKRAEQLAAAIKLADRAATRFPDSPQAQFAVFCSLGRQLETSKNHLQSLFLVRRAHHAIQKALALQPNYIDALVAHGAMMGQLPWMLGGDNDQAESLIRRALSLDPAFLPAYRELASLLQAQGRGEEAHLVDVARATD
jgi:tetratricopeptide (TPR) repeat protein